MKRLMHKDIFGMSRVGKIDTCGDIYEVFVNTDDSGKIPHFHFRVIEDWSKFHTCIRVDSPKYFLHSNKQDRLNAKQRKELQKFMVAPTDANVFKATGEKMNNWEYVCMLWNANNSDVIIPDNIDQPDYTQLR